MKAFLVDSSPSYCPQSEDSAWSQAGKAPTCHHLPRPGKTTPYPQQGKAAVLEGHREAKLQAQSR